MFEILVFHDFDLRASLRKPVLWAFVAGALTALIALVMPNYYRSEAQLLPVESKGMGGNLGGLASAAAAFGVGIPGGESSDANFVDILNSRWLKEQLLQTEFHYHTKSWRFGTESSIKGTLYGYLVESQLGVDNTDRALKALGTVLSASRDMKSKVISISAETKSPELSQLVVQRAGKLLEVFLLEKGQTRGGAKAAFAEARLKEARSEMNASEDAFLRFLEANRNYQTSADPSVRLKGSRLETELHLRQQLVSTIAMSREQALMEEKNDIPILNILDPGNLPIEKSKPARSVWVLLVMLLVGPGGWIWLNRAWVGAKLSGDECESHSITRENM